MTPPPARQETDDRWNRIIHFMRTRVGLLMAISFAVMFVYGALLPKVPFNFTLRGQQQLQTSHILSLALFSYANNHGGKYPDGKSSTEIFQQLIDGKYLADPTILYFPMTGKVKPVTPQNGKITLKPENVCYDVTSGVTEDSPEEMPLVYMTGYRVKYEAGAPAIRLSNGFEEGITVGYKSNGAKFILISPDKKTIPEFVPPTFDPKERIYRQLTPNGELTPP